MRSLLRKLARDWKLKLAALGLAMLLWVAVSADQPTSTWVELPVEVRVTDPGFEVVQGPIPEVVDVRLTGTTRELLELAWDDPPLVLSVDEVSGEAEYFALESQMVRIPSGMSVAVRDVRPSSVLLDFGRLESREVPVAVRIARGPGEGRVLAGILEAQPPRVRITGSSARIEEIDTVFTQPLDLSREDSVFRRSVALDTEGLQGLELSVSEIQVTGQVDPAATRVIAGVPVETPAGVAAAPQAVDVLLRGAESVIQQLTASDLRAEVPAATVPAQIPFAGLPLAVRIEGLPSNVEAEANPGVVRVFPAPEPAVEGAEPSPTDGPGPADTISLPGAAAPSNR